MTELPLDPSEYPGTPEYEEVFTMHQERRRLMLDLLEEDRAYAQLQYPYRHSN